jgi:hypothetical protein
MSTIQILPPHHDAKQIGHFLVSTPTGGVGPASELIKERLKALGEPTPTFAATHRHKSQGLDEQLYDALATFKITTAAVAMHLDRDWRSKLFEQLDSLLALEDWEAADPPPSIESFSTLLRMLTSLRPERRPGLGATEDGNFIASWTTTKDDRLTIECLTGDIARWHLAVTIDDERERAAGITPVHRLAEVLQPYAPKRWFRDAEQVRAG